jgi:hypothetical protein
MVVDAPAQIETSDPALIGAFARIDTVPTPAVLTHPVVVFVMITE